MVGRGEIHTLISGPARSQDNSRGICSCPQFLGGTIPSERRNWHSRCDALGSCLQQSGVPHLGLGPKPAVAWEKCYLLPTAKGAGAWGKISMVGTCDSVGTYQVDFQSQASKRRILNTSYRFEATGVYAHIKNSADCHSSNGALRRETTCCQTKLQPGWTVVQ